MMTMQYVRIPVQDLQASAAFYGELLDTQATFHPTGEYAEVIAEPLFIALIGPGVDNVDPRTPTLDRRHVTVTLPAMPSDRIADVMARHGIEHRIGAPFRDPDGHTLMRAAPISSKAPAAPPRPLPPTPWSRPRAV